jgi:hypothetical protein
MAAAALPALTALLAAMSLHAEETPVLRLAVDPDNGAAFVEAYNNKRSVSGQRLAGVRLGPATPVVDVSRLFLAAGGVPAGSRICVRSTTSDAAYWALNPYATSSTQGRIAQLDYPTRFKEELGSYGGDALALRATLSRDCTEDGSGDVIPFVLDPEAPADTLTAFVNAAEPFARATLRGSDGTVLVTSKCQKVDGPRQAFGWVCRLPLSGLANLVQVTLAVDVVAATGRKGKPIVARIVLPPGGP